MNTIYSVLVAWFLLLPPVRDLTSQHTPFHRPEHFGEAIAQVVDEVTRERASAGLPAVDHKLLAATLDVLAAHESSYRQGVRGDSGRSCGLFQTPCAETPMPAAGERPSISMAKRQARVAIKWVLYSWERCPEHPLSLYATGRYCGKLWVSDTYQREIKAEVAVPTPDGKTALAAQSPTGG